MSDSNSFEKDIIQKLTLQLKDKGYYDFSPNELVKDEENSMIKAEIDLCAKNVDGIKYCFEIKINYRRHTITHILERIAYVRTFTNCDRWVLVFAGEINDNLSTYISERRSLLNKMGISIWRLRGNNIIQMFEPDISLKSNKPMEDYMLFKPEATRAIWKSIKSVEQKNFLDALQSEYKLGREREKSETQLEFKKQFKSMIYNDFLGGGLFAGGGFLIVDGTIRAITHGIYHTVVELQNWLTIIAGAMMLVISISFWFKRYRNAKKNNK